MNPPLYVGRSASLEQGACSLPNGGFQLVVIQSLGAIDEEIVQLSVAEAEEALLGVSSDFVVLAEKCRLDQF